MQFVIGSEQRAFVNFDHVAVVFESVNPALTPVAEPNHPGSVSKPRQEREIKPHD